MPTQSTIAEFHALPREDLLREIASQQSLLTKMRLGIDAGKEKDSARYRREKKALARMETALSKKGQETLNPKKKPSTVSAS